MHANLVDLRIQCYRHANMCVHLNSFCDTLHVHVGGTSPVLRRIIALNEHQLSILENFFAVHRYPNRTTFKELALQTGLPKVQVSDWFQSKRRDERVRKGGEVYIYLYIYIYIYTYT